jgi:hypothetical protein
MKPARHGGNASVGVDAYCAACARDPQTARWGRPVQSLDEAGTWDTYSLIDPATGTPIITIIGGDGGKGGSRGRGDIPPDGGS